MFEMRFGLQVQEQGLSFCVERARIYYDERLRERLREY